LYRQSPTLVTVIFVNFFTILLTFYRTINLDGDFTLCVFYWSPAQLLIKLLWQSRPFSTSHHATKSKRRKLYYHLRESLQSKLDNLHIALL